MGQVLVAASGCKVAAAAASDVGEGATNVRPAALVMACVGATVDCVSSAAVGSPWTSASARVVMPSMKRKPGCWRPRATRRSPAVTPSAAGWQKVVDWARENCMSSVSSARLAWGAATSGR